MSVAKGGALERVFVVGCRRSGTTWTMMLLAQHPEVVALQQTDVMRRLFYFTSWFREGHTYGRCALTAHRQEGIAPAPNGLTRVGLESLLDEERLYELARPLSEEIFQRAAATNPRARVMVEQTPEHLSAARQILRVYPDASFVNVVRDPRAVFASHRGAARDWARPSFFSGDPVRVADEWRRALKRGRAIGDLTERYLELRYEDLKTDTERQLERLHAFLGLASDGAERARAIEACGLDRLRAANLAPRGFFRRGEAEGWRGELSRGERRTIEHLCGDWMEALGYRSSGPLPVPPPVRLRLRRLRERGGDHLRHLANDTDGLTSRVLGAAARHFPALRRALMARPR